MPLTGPQLDLIHETILTAYDRDTFRRAMKAGLDVDFDAVAPEKGFDTQLWTFLNWANRQERVKDVVRCAWERNRENAELAALWQSVQGWDPDEAPPAAQGAGDVAPPTIGVTQTVGVNSGTVIGVVEHYFAAPVNDPQRQLELAYLGALVRKYQEWEEYYTPLEGIAEVHGDGAETATIPIEFELLLKQAARPEARMERVPVKDLRDTVTSYR